MRYGRTAPKRSARVAIITTTENIFFVFLEIILFGNF